jgi:hypothetical protein
MATPKVKKVQVKAHVRTVPLRAKPKAPPSPAAAFGMPMPGQMPEQTPGYRGGGQVDPLANPTLRDTSHDDVAWRNTPGATSLEQYQAQQVQRGAQSFNDDLRRTAGSNLTTGQAQDRANQYAGIQADAMALGKVAPAAQVAQAKPAVDPAQDQAAAAAGDLQAQPAAAAPLTAPKPPQPTTFGIGLDYGSWTSLPGDATVSGSNRDQLLGPDPKLFARGGPIVGGIPGRDTVDIKAQQGEYELPVPTVRAVGKPALDQLVRDTTGQEPGPQPITQDGRPLPRGNTKRPAQVGRHPAAAFERGGRADPLIPIALAAAPAAALAAQPYAAAAGRALAYPYTENQVVNRVPKPNASTLMDGRQPASPSAVTHASRAMAPAELDAIRRTGFATPPPGGSAFSPEGKWWSAADEQGRFGRAWKAGADAQTVRAPIDAVSANRAVPARALQVLSPAGEWGPVGANRGAAGMTMAKTALGRVGSAAGRAAAVVGGSLATGVGLALTPSNRIATDDQEQAQMPGGRYPAAAFGQGGPVQDEAYFHQNFNTALTPAEQAQYQSWAATQAQAKGRPVGSDDTYDYDNQGYWKGNVATGQPTVDPSGRGHTSDQYKKPNHPTFSDQSIYSGTPNPGGGTYQGGTWAPDASTYTPSQSMLDSTHEPGRLQRYMDRAEPNTRVVLPPGTPQKYGPGYAQGGAVERAAQALTNRRQYIDSVVAQAESGTSTPPLTPAGYSMPPAPVPTPAPVAGPPAPRANPTPASASNAEWMRAHGFAGGGEVPGFAGGGSTAMTPAEIADYKWAKNVQGTPNVKFLDYQPLPLASIGVGRARADALVDIPAKLPDQDQRVADWTSAPVVSTMPAVPAVASAPPPAAPVEHWWTPKPIGNALYDRKQAAKDQAADRGNAYGGTGASPALQAAVQSVPGQLDNALFGVPSGIGGAVAAAPAAAAQAIENTPMVQQDRAMQARIEAQNRENLGPGNPFVGLGRQRPARLSKEAQAALDVRPDAPKPAAAFGQPAATATQENSLASEDAYQRQIEAAGGRRLAGGGWEMPANAAVTPQGLDRQIRANGGTTMTAAQAFTPERVAAARADAQAHPNKPDSYGGYDVSQMGPAEYGALQQQMAAEAQDLAGAKAYYAMPPDERGPAPASVQRAMAPGVSPSAAFGMKAEERARGSAAATQKLQADLLGEQIKAGGTAAKDSGIAKRAENKQFTSTFDSLTKGVAGGEPGVEGEHRDAAISTLGALEAAGYGLDVDAKTKAAMAAGYARTRSKIMAQAQAEALKQGLVGPAADAYLADAAKRADVQARAQFKPLMGG